jgi:ABC-2 type transport system permease protein
VFGTLPDRVLSMAVGGDREHGRQGLVLGAWCVVRLMLCLATFRWTDRSDR